MIVNIPVSSHPLYECGAMLFAHFTIPDPAADQQRAELHAALCNMALLAMGQNDEHWLWSPQLIKPGYALMRETDVKHATKTVDRRLRDRLDAAIMVKPFLQQIATGRRPRLPLGVDHLSLESMGEFVRFRTKSDPDKGDVKNVHGRVWRPSVPVIHVAVALDSLYDVVAAVPPIKLAIHDLIQSREVIEFLVKTASQLEPILPKIHRLHINEDQLIKFRLI